MKKIKEKFLKFFGISSELKRVGSFALAFLLSFLAIAPSLKAATGSSEWIPGFYYKASGGTYGQMTRLKIDGEDVFCLEPGKVFNSGSGYSQGDVSSILSENQKNKIELIHHFGYILKGKGDTNRAFTQVAIWEIVGGYVTIGSSTGANDKRDEYESWLSDVNGKISSLMSVPSWNGSTITGKVGQTIILDGEGKLDYTYYIRDYRGCDVKLEGGKVKIGITSNSKNGLIKFEKKILNNELSQGITLLYQKAGSQKVGKIKLSVDPPVYNINLEVQKEPTRARVHKVGDEKEGVKDATFQMSYTKNFEPKQTWEYTTDKNGYTEFDTWNVMGKTVYVREKSVPAPYIKSDEVKTFVVEPGKTHTITFVNKKQRAKLRLAKVGEVLDKYKDEKVMVKDKTYTVKTPIFKNAYIPGAKFDIKQNGKVIKTVISKKDFVEVELPLGKYQVEEKEAPAGYIKADKVYDVNLIGKEATITKNLEVKNEREKVKLNLTKSFEKGMFKKETWAVFGLFTKEKQNGLEKDTLLEVLEFDKENSTKEFKNTIKGKYYVKELDNSSGYRKDEKTHDVDLSKEKVATKTIINKLKRGAIQILKVDKNNNEIKLEGVTFKLLANNSKRTEVATKKTNKEGSVTFENLEVGEYILVETETKTGYILDAEERIIRVKDDEKITMETVENSPTTVIVHKTGTDTNDEQVEDCEFEIIEVEETKETKEKQGASLNNFNVTLDIFKREESEEKAENILV
ncbi:MAG: Cys-Gln thioester bond-forming surface protein [Parvimonas sp.]|uniref:SpaA isopeptide-forming pilin-related protein n=1 Tax=Parvimonas sp. TaxID=1944660 RepID=UPI0025CC6266|nr:SpaA isopeptide-forming pilin-related protein [Parvimonas sp.]MCI5997050.1 Cys-Gln thioester bond-forming surface protein [Parvimonas sp.]